MQAKTHLTQFRPSYFGIYHLATSTYLFKTLYQIIYHISKFKSVRQRLQLKFMSSLSQAPCVGSFTKIQFGIGSVITLKLFN